MLKAPKYRYNQYILKVYGFGANKKIKLIRMNVLRIKGIEDDTDKEKKKIKGSVN